jgi:hypothetical protein
MLLLLNNRKKAKKWKKMTKFVIIFVKKLLKLSTLTNNICATKHRLYITQQTFN